jgi:hypothetical protein
LGGKTLSLIVSPAVNAESYVSVADADTYHANRGNASWAALTTTQKEQALRKATDYMVGAYQSRWIEGYGDLETDDVPNAIANACASLGLKSTTTELAPDVGRAKTMVKVDGAVEVEYSEYSSQLTSYTSIDAMLMPYLMDGSNGYNHKVIRA